MDLLEDEALVHVHLHADRSVRRHSMTSSELDIGAECLEWNVAFFEHIATSDFCTIETTGHTNLHTDGSCLHRALDGHLACSAVWHSALDLALDALGNTNSVCIWILDFVNIDLKRTAKFLLELLAEIFDSSTLLTDDHAWLTAIEDNGSLLPAIDLDGAHASILELLLKETANLHISEEESLVLLLRCKPCRRPRVRDAETEAVGVNFLTHNS